MTAASVEDLGEAATASTRLNLLVAVADEIMHHALGLPAHDSFQIGERVIAVANRFAGFKRSLFKLLFFLAGLLPILVGQLLQLRLPRAEAESRQPFRLPSFHIKTEHNRPAIESLSMTQKGVLRECTGTAHLTRKGQNQ